MQVIRIDLVTPGQVTAEHVRNLAGGTLIGAGTTLNAAHIRSLKTAGVESVAIQVDENTKNIEQFSPVSRLAALDALFEGVADPTLLQIRQAAEKHLHAMLTGVN